VTVQRATSQRRPVLDAIDRVQPTALNTAIGGGILGSLDAVAGKRLAIDAQALSTGARQPKLPYLGGAVVVLFTDGNSNAGVDPAGAAAVAEQAGVRVDPVGIATAAGAVVDVEGYQIATQLNAAPLKQIASTTNGTYFSGVDSAAADKITSGIDRKLTYEGKKDEVTALVAAGAVVVLLAGAAFSIRWFGRVP
jgi:Ca-activated chloride channel family protein